MSKVELDFATTDPKVIADAYLRNGCVLLRNFTDPKRIGPIRDVTRKLYDELEAPHVFEQDMLSRNNPSLSSYLFTDRHRDLLNVIFSTYSYDVSLGGTHSRRVSPPDASEGWMPPLGFHIDAEFHGFEFTVNFWAPFQHCGDDSPGLATVAAPFLEVLDYLNFDGQPESNRGNGEWALHQFAPILKKCLYKDPNANEEMQAHFGDRVWKPVFEAGDAMLISNWTLHGTYATGDMKKSRESVELRFKGPAMLNDILATHGLKTYQPVSVAAE